MWDWLKKANGFFKNNADSLQGIGAIIGGAGNAYSAYKQSRAAEKNYNLNLDILREEKRRRNQAQQSLNSGWNLSNFNIPYKKQEEEGI